jgi:hypothetical protein
LLKRLSDAFKQNAIESTKREYKQKMKSNQRDKLEKDLILIFLNKIQKVKEQFNNGKITNQQKNQRIDRLEMELEGAQSTLDDHQDVSLDKKYKFINSFKELEKEEEKKEEEKIKVEPQIQNSPKEEEETTQNNFELFQNLYRINRLDPLNDSVTEKPNQLRNDYNIEKEEEANKLRRIKEKELYKKLCIFKILPEEERMECQALKEHIDTYYRQNKRVLTEEELEIREKRRSRALRLMSQVDFKKLPRRMGQNNYDIMFKTEELLVFPIIEGEKSHEKTKRLFDELIIEKLDRNVFDNLPIAEAEQLIEFVKVICEYSFKNHQYLLRKFD